MQQLYRYIYNSVAKPLDRSIFPTIHGLREENRLLIDRGIQYVVSICDCKNPIFLVIYSHQINVTR